MLSRRMLFTFCSVAITALALAATRFAHAEDPEIKGGIAGTVVKIDATNGTLTISDKEGRERTYSITDETVIVGPRGGVVHRRLKDHRFHSGLPITVVAEGKTAAELHLGYDRKAAREGAAGTASRTRSSRSQSPTNDTNTNETESSTPQSSPAPSTSTTRTSRFRGLQEKRATAKDADEEEDENEFPGKVKSVDPAKHLLVITLLNGKDRSFLVASSVKVQVNGRESRHGLSDAAFKPDTRVTVVTDRGGRKVEEVKLNTSLLRRLRKAS